MPAPLRRALRPALLVAAVALAGCFDIVSTVVVRPDGSALVRDSVAFSGMGDLFGDAAVPDKEALRVRAASLGEGVTLVGMADHDGGYTAIYAAPDVGALRYSLPDLALGDDPDAETTFGDAFDLAFAFERGDPATLRIVVPEGRGADSEPAAQPTAEEVAGAERGVRVARALLGDARVEVHVEVEGRVVESDAAFRDGSAVTLAAFDVGEVFDALGGTPWMASLTPPSPRQLRALLAGRDDVRLQGSGVVTVRFE